MNTKLLRAVARRIRRSPNDLKNAYLASKVNRNRSKSNRDYIEHPNVTAVLQFFNKRQNIRQIITALRQSGIEEVIVIDDGSVDGSFAEWMRYLTGPNDFLLRCNDIYEVRTYDRAIGMAKGKFVCLLQDDDLLPNGDAWVRQALCLFDRFPDLLLLGGRDGADLLIPDPVPVGASRVQYEEVGDMAGCPGVNKFVLHRTPSFVDPTTRIPFMFSMTVNRAPTFLRKEQFVSLGGICQMFAPFQCDDVDAGIRAWLAGYKVGLYECPCSRNVGVGGMRLFNDHKQAQINKNWALIYRLWGSKIKDGDLQSLVDDANAQLSPRVLDVVPPGTLQGKEA